MYLTFLGEVLKRAFTPTPRLTDGLQIAAASALPALASFAGIELPEGTQEGVLAYIGLVALSFFLIRLFWAPYAIWKDDRAEIGGLKLELTKPERLILEHLAKHRAKARVKLANIMHDIAMTSHIEDTQARKAELSRLFVRAHRLSSKAGNPHEFVGALMTFSEICRAVTKEKPREKFPQLDARDLMIDYIHSRITIEELLLRLPKDIEQEKQQ